MAKAIDNMLKEPTEKTAGKLKFSVDSRSLRAGALEGLAADIFAYSTLEDGESPFNTAIDGFILLRSDYVKQPAHRVFKPALCFTVQGTKWTKFGETRYDYSAGKALLITVEMPSRGVVAAAAPGKPFLGVIVELDRLIMQEVLEQTAILNDDKSQCKVCGVCILELSVPLIDCIHRAVRLLRTPEAIPVLYPGVMREICYWLVKSEGGLQIARVSFSSGRDKRIVHAVEKIQKEFATEMRVDHLASDVGMSVAAFHRQFKTLTAMTPLQYQKQVRLLEARRLMLSTNKNVENAAYDVGYESPSQFSREYTRMFGVSPRRDVASFVR